MWNENKYERADEAKRAQEHNCVDDRANCDAIHPNIAGFTFVGARETRPYQAHPPEWRNWILDAKVVMSYFNRHSLTMERFNVTEAFSQMSTNGKLNTVHSIIERCLDDNERSMLFSDLRGS